MSAFINSISIQDVPNSQVNFSNGIQAVKIENLDADTNSVLYSTDGVNIKGDSAILKFEQDIKKLSVSNDFSYVSNYPIGVQAGWDEATFHTGVFSQNKNSDDGASTHILITNDLGTDSSNYAGLDMCSSNSTIQYGQFGTMPNALGISSQTSSIVITSNAGGQEPTIQNENIMLCYANGTKALVVNKYGQLVVGCDNPNFSGDSYGGDDGGTDKVLTSNSTAGLKWVQAPLYNVVMNVFRETNQATANTPSNDTILFSKNNQAITPLLRCEINYISNFQLGNNNQTLNFVLKNTDTNTTIQTITQFVQATGHRQVCVNFEFTAGNVSTLSYSISLNTNGGTNITIGTDDFYSITFNQLTPSS